MGRPMPGYVPVVFCFDANYANYAAVATFSAFANSVAALKVYWIVPASDLETANSRKARLALLGIDIVVQPVDSAHFADWKEVLHITRGAYLRLLIPETVAEDKVIYLDSDVIVQADLSPLYSTDLGPHAIAGALDTVAGAQMSKMPLAKPASYVNSGVLVMDLKRLRQDGFFLKCRDIYEKHAPEVTWADQCIINKYAESGKKILHPKWNHFAWPMKNPEGEEAEAQSSAPCIIHFVAQTKPWHAICSPDIADVWWQYADKIRLVGLTRLPYPIWLRLKTIRRRIKGCLKKIFLGTVSATRGA
jgi:lipopolysaccharide biosynthesis glycosyltransferase